MKKIGILSAMPEEIRALLNALTEKRTSTYGMRDYHEGKLFGVDCVLVFSRWGKVAAASTASDLISRFQVSEIIFTGVAGGVGEHVKVGDVVIANHLVQHDIDARPIFERYQIPLLGVSKFEVSGEKVNDLKRAVDAFVQKTSPRPTVHVGLIASGDQFFGSTSALVDLRARLPGVLCVEMEGAAVAQVCFEHQMPFSIFRTVSDSADEAAPVDFKKFIDEVASRYSYEILRILISDST